MINGRPDISILPIKLSRQPADALHHIIADRTSFIEMKMHFLTRNFDMSGSLRVAFEGEEPKDALE